MSIFDKIGLDLSGLTSDSMIVSSGGTTTFALGKRTPYTASINGVNIQSYVTLREASLTRLSLLDQFSQGLGRSYKLVTGIMKPVKFDIELMIDGELMPFTEFLRQVVDKNLTHDEFLMAARRIGINFTDGMPLFFQQFGASMAGWTKAREAFVAAGATDARVNMQKPGNIEAAYAHATGVPVTQLELGTVDRSKSVREQGFLNLVDAQVDQFTRIIKLRTEAQLLKDQADSVKLSQEKIKAINAKSKVLTDMSKQWVSSWSGAQQRIEQLSNGKLEKKDQFDPTNAPCGRFTMLIDNQAVEVDLWSNSTVANAGAETAKPVIKNDEFEPI